MKLVKRIVGIIGVILGAVGLILAIAQVVGIWTVNSPLTRGVQDLSGGLQNGLAVADGALIQANTLVQELRAELQMPPEQRQELTNTLGNSVTAIDTTLEGASSSIQATQALFSATRQVPLVGRNPEQRAVITALDRAAGAVDAASRTLDELEQDAAELAQASTQTIAELDAELETVQGELAGLQTQLSDAQATLAEIEKRIPWWIDLGSLSLTLVFVWYGVAQGCLLLLAWRWVRQPGA